MAEGSTAMEMTLDHDEVVAFIREEQVSLWSDLDQAIGRALNGIWSISAGDIARRIVAVARLVGPVDGEEAPWQVFAGGVYEAVLAVGEITVDPPDEARCSAS